MVRSNIVILKLERYQRCSFNVTQHSVYELVVHLSTTCHVISNDRPTFTVNCPRLNRRKARPKIGMRICSVWTNSPKTSDWKQKLIQPQSIRTDNEQMMKLRGMNWMNICRVVVGRLWTMWSDANWPILDSAHADISLWMTWVASNSCGRSPIEASSSKLYWPCHRINWMFHTNANCETKYLQIVTHSDSAFVLYERKRTCHFVNASWDRFCVSQYFVLTFITWMLRSGQFARYKDWRHTHTHTYTKNRQRE